ncbi:MAG: rane protein [Acidimicrobiales bacterium]|nr:rane protein [Acidimicrobiales bacterium]
MAETIAPGLARSARKSHPGRPEALGVLAVSIIAGVVAALCHVSPTGSRGTDVAVTFALACFVSWLAASAPWWAITASAVVAVIGVGLGPWVVVALAGLLIGIAIGWLPEGYPWPRSLAAGCVVVALLHVSINPFIGASAIISGAAMMFLGIVGLALRGEKVRARVVWGLVGVVVLILAASAGLGLAASHASSKLRAGTDLLQDGLDQLRAGNTTGAAQSLRDAASDLDAARTSLDAVWTQPSRLLPVVAQHRELATRVVTDASSSAIAAATALDAVDIDQLRLVSGSLNIDALAKLAKPLRQLDAAVRNLSHALDGGDSPWLIGPVRARLEDGRDKLTKALVQTSASAAVAEHGPALLGADGVRRYLVVFTSPGTARGLSGTISDYAEIAITNGVIKQTAFGRVDDLVTKLAAAGPVQLHENAEYFARYGAAGAGSATTPVDPGFWSNVTMSPDTPTASRVMAAMYAASTKQTIDGVITMDPVGVAALVDVAGPIVIPDSATLTGSLGGLLIGHDVSAAALQQFLLVDQYTLAPDVRVQLDQAAAGAALQQFLAAKLPAVQELADALGPAATQGHISWWTSRDDEEAAFVAVGMAGAFPEIDGSAASQGDAGGAVPPRSDGLAIVSNDASGNSLDAYLQRTVAYDASYDRATGRVVGDVTVSLRNAVPSSSLPPDVIGNSLGLPVGTNRMELSIYSPLSATVTTMNGASVDPNNQPELGWNVSTVEVDIAPGATVTVTVHLEGTIAAGGYSLVWRPQPVTAPDTLQLQVLDGSPAGLTYDGALNRTSLLDAAGVTAVR